MAILEVRNITKRFGGLTAVSDVSFKIEPNQIYALIGPNGAGKTTVFNMITGVYQVSSGDIVFEGETICGLAPYKIVKKGIARTYQNIRLFKKMTAVENVMTGFHCRTRAGLFNIVFQRKKMLAEDRDTRKSSEEILEYLKIADRKDELASSLPYGHQRILEIGRALATKPKVLLLDEPAAGMNTEEKKELINTILRIRKDFNIAVLLVEHDMSLVMSISDEITVLNYGSGIAQGKPEEVQSDEAVIEAYLGRSDEGEQEIIEH